MKRMMIASATAAMALAGPLALAPSANAAPLFTGGLVNVTVTDVIDGDVLSNNNVSVGAALGVVANVCDVNVGGILGQLRDDGTATCTADGGGQRVDITQISRR